MGDKSEVYEESYSQSQTSQMMMGRGDVDEEPPNSSDFSNEMGHIKSILKKKNSQGSNAGGTTAPFIEPHTSINQTGSQQFTL